MPLSPEMRRQAAAAPIWQADAVPLPVAFEDSASERPVAVLVTAAELIVGSDQPTRLRGDPESVAEAIDRALADAANRVGCYPEGVAVRFAELAGPLRDRLVGRQVFVQVAERLPDIEVAARGLMEHLTGHSTWPPLGSAPSWSAWRLPERVLREIFVLAADFWRRAPWRFADSMQAPRVRMPSGREWTAAVMGAAVETEGLAVYSDSADLFRSLGAETPEEALATVRGRIFSLQFDPASSLHPAMVREARLAGREVASPRAFPHLITVNTPAGGISREDADDLIALLRVIPEFAEQHRETLLREQESGRPTEPIEWCDSATTIQLRYDPRELMVDQLLANVGDTTEITRNLGLDKIFEEVTRELGPDASEEAVLALANERAQRAAEEYNQGPQEELGGLSPRQVATLMYGDWNAPGSGMWIDQGVPSGIALSIDMVANAQAMLRLALASGGLPATAAGNLKPDVVKQLLVVTSLPDRAGDYLAAKGRIRETDVWPIHIVRVLLELADLLERRGKRFVVSEDGRALAEEDAAGRLFARLFHAHFQRLDLDYLSGAEWPQLQDQIPVTLYQLSRLDDSWRTAAELLPLVLLPFARDAAPTPEAWARNTFERRILVPLSEMRLLERSAADPFAEVRFRPTPLFDRLLRFKV